MDPDPAYDQALEAAVPTVKAMTSAPPRKRARTTAVPAGNALKRRGKRKSLSRLTDMPLDVIFDIFSNLLPGDLVSLSRSTKSFRQLLMRRSSITIWQAARRNVPDLPDCPPELSEPAYANLLFTTNCHYCGKQGIQTIEWLLLARCCKSCRENPIYFFDATNHPNGRKRDWSKLYFPSITRGRSVYVRMSDLVPFLEGYERQGDGSENLDVLLRQTMEKTLLWKKRSSQYQIWDDRRNRNRELELDAIRDQRRRAVWAKLAELGLGDEEPLLNSYDKDRLENLEGMKEPTVLTERNWLKVKDPIIGWVRGMRKERLRKERSAPYSTIVNAMIPLLDAYGCTQSLSDCFPSIMELCHVPQVRAYIDELVDSGAALDAVRFTMLIPVAIQRWHDDISDHLLPLLPPWLDSTRGIAALHSALVWFHCAHQPRYCDSWCRDTTIGYPRMLVHTHAKRERCVTDEPHSADDDLVNGVRENCLRSSLVFDPDELKANITFDLHASFAAAEIVRLCGLDPATAMAEDMDDLDARIACAPCKMTMTWRKAVSHVYKPCHKGRREWVLLCNKDNAALKKLEAKDRPKTTTGAFWCMRCRRFERTGDNFFSFKGLKALKTHMERSHHVLQFRPRLGVDYYVHEGEATNDKERPYPVNHQDLNFKISTPELVALGW